MRTAIAVLVLVAVSTATAEEKTYDLKLDWKFSKGQTFVVREAKVQSMDLVVRQGETPVNQQNKRTNATFQYTEAILEVRDGERAKTSLAFQKAGRMEGEKMVPYGFQGKTVIATHPADGKTTFQLQGEGTLTAEDQEALTEYFGEDGTDEGPSGEELLAPKDPVKVGESWKPQIAAMAKELEGLTIDAAKSDGKLTLEKVEVRDGREMGRVTGWLNFAVSGFGPLKVEESLSLAFQVAGWLSLDPNTHVGEFDMSGNMKGTRDVEMQGQAFAFEIDMKFKQNEKRKLKK